MTEAEYLSCDDAGKMLASLTQGLKGLSANYGRIPSARRLRLFALACAGGTESGSDWNLWAEHPEGDSQGWLNELFSLDGARYWTGQKIGQHHVHKLAPGESQRQAAFLRDIVGNPWRPVTRKRDEKDVPPLIKQLHPQHWPEHRWLSSPTVLAIAQRIHEERDWEAMPVLADCLEEAGCESEGLLRHLRGQELVPQLNTGDPPLAWYRPLRGPHVRGCWATDLILGKE